MNTVVKFPSTARKPAVQASLPRVTNTVPDDSIDAETLLGMDFAPLEYVIPGYVVEGLTVLGGKPKLGKS
jgi:hypothetical protein